MTEQTDIGWLFAAIRAHQAEDGSLPGRICDSCLAALPVDGASLSLMVDGGTRERVGASGYAADAVLELEITVGEGPGLDAFTSGNPVLVADIEGEERIYWPAFADGAATLGTRAIFAFPLQLGAIRFGIFTLTRQAPGPLPSDALAQVLRASDVTSLLLLGTHGELAQGFDADWLEGVAWTREVHQATGMVISQLGVGVEEAFVRLRAFAFAHGMPLSKVANQVVTRRLVFTEEEG